MLTSCSVGKSMMLKLLVTCWKEKSTAMIRKWCRSRLKKISTVNVSKIRVTNVAESGVPGLLSEARESPISCPTYAPATLQGIKNRFNAVQSIRPIPNSRPSNRKLSTIPMFSSEGKPAFSVSPNQNTERLTEMPILINNGSCRNENSVKNATNVVTRVTTRTNASTCASVILSPNPPSA